jgi:hypothetical protein
MKRPAFVMLALFTLTAVGACSDDGGGERPTEGAEAEVADAVEAYFAAFTGGDAAAARSFLSARCNEILVDPGFADLVTGSSEAFPDLEIESWETVEVDGDNATVEYETGEEAIDAQGPVEWINEGGAWKYDAC